METGNRNKNSFSAPNIQFGETRVIHDLEELKTVVKGFQSAGLKIVFTQGVFDLIHEGHGKYLELAKQQGDILVVGVDSDELTRKRKGPNRPVVPESERVRMLTYLRSVDIITMRTLSETDKDMGYLHKELRPDIFVMSTTTKDFPIEQQRDTEKYVGKIKIFEPQAETSSSARIRHLMIDGATGLGQKINELVNEYYDEIKKLS
jgi:D-glycero-beta-D-manno-heptose 1-phosphate adenylyltransferase